MASKTGITLREFYSRNQLRRDKKGRLYRSDIPRVNPNPNPYEEKRGRDLYLWSTIQFRFINSKYLTEAVIEAMRESHKTLPEYDLD